ncbi:hypothetical protein LP422_22855 [Janibacter limosus]|nr:hypothetical protein LP422_22855 [Janibacter limosus]
MLGPVARVQLGVEDVEDLGPLGHLRPVLGRLGVDDAHVGAVLEQGIGCGEAADPETGDDDAQTAPVSLAAGQARQSCIPWVGTAHGAPTTHSP